MLGGMKNISLPLIRMAFLKIGTFMLDTIAPPDPVVRKIENMSVTEYIQSVKQEPLPLEKTAPYALLSYKDPLVKTAVLEVKSYGNKKLALLLGSVLYRHLSAELATNLPPHTRLLIIPIPITRKSLRARGWNQCERIGIGLRTCDTAGRFELRTDILYKIRETADQVGKNRQERFENLKHSFSVLDPDKVRGREVVLVDDILTTGATLGEAARAIESAGAVHVTCIALAH